MEIYMNTRRDPVSFDTLTRLYEKARENKDNDLGDLLSSIFFSMLNSDRKHQDVIRASYGDASTLPDVNDLGKPIKEEKYLQQAIKSLLMLSLISGQSRGINHIHLHLNYETYDKLTSLPFLQDYVTHKEEETTNDNGNKELYIQFQYMGIGVTFVRHVPSKDK